MTAENNNLININNFISRWKDTGGEKGDTQKFWLEIFRDVLDISEPDCFIEFEKPVALDHNNFIDAYVRSMKIIIEQKSFGVDLNKSYKQSDGNYLTPFEQAKRYYDWLPASERGRWIITCNFQEIWVYDMETPHADPEIIKLENLEREFIKLNILLYANAPSPKEIREIEISKEACRLIRKFYDAVEHRYIKPNSAEALRNLNILCVRLVFLLYAEDAGLFARNLFYDYLKLYKHDARQAIINLFEALSIPENKRSKYMSKDLKAFPYVDGGLFEEQGIEVPNLNDPDDTPVKIILEDMSIGFDWSGINPTIFGALFESTLNPETRRTGGMHYTSINNIHKLIDPLFMDKLNLEFEEVMNSPTNLRLRNFQRKLASLKFLDPACGSGNFLTESYLSLRRLENKVIKVLMQNKFTPAKGDTLIKVSISQFYGIEINDFAAAVARTALWIAEVQMWYETQKLDTKQSMLPYMGGLLPLKSSANIAEVNALKIDWRKIIKPEDLDYIMGNPPFVGYSMQTQEQKDEMLKIYVDENNKPYKTAGKIDYVAAWYFKASEFIQNTPVQAAFVSTNSITQGEQVADIWRPLIERFKIQINFAWRAFKWESESDDMAQVHVVIIGFSCSEYLETKKIYTEIEPEVPISKEEREKAEKAGTPIIFKETHEAENITPYITDAETVLVKARRKPLCDVPEILLGSMPRDGGNLILTEEERDELLQKSPEAKKFIRPYLGSFEFINSIKRYCLWLVDLDPKEFRKMPFINERIKAVKKFRLKSKKEGTRKLASVSHLFAEIRQPDKNYILIPRVSSSERIYIPMDFVSPEIIASDASSIIPGASLYHFGILTSRVHMAWMRAVAGRLKSDYRFSGIVVYNNFPWPVFSHYRKDLQKRGKIEQTAQQILDARAAHPKSTFADMYDDTFMPIDLRKAHWANDAAVCRAYGFKINISEDEIVAALMKMYKELTE
ncbi:MAG: N-6 DNA methylase [Synergistaceae bacterium]|nr:N-6 DNA methylase [Synergistaceae bacterium]